MAGNPERPDRVHAMKHLLLIRRADPGEPGPALMIAALVTGPRSSPDGAPADLSALAPKRREPLLPPAWRYFAMVRGPVPNEFFLLPPLSAQSVGAAVVGGSVCGPRFPGSDAAASPALASEREGVWRPWCAI